MNFFSNSKKFWSFSDLIFSISQKPETKFLALKMLEKAIKV